MTHNHQWTEASRHGFLVHCLCTSFAGGYRGDVCGLWVVPHLSVEPYCMELITVVTFLPKVVLPCWWVSP
jgi:hypothetical protein